MRSYLCHCYNEKKLARKTVRMLLSDSGAKKELCFEYLYLHVNQIKCTAVISTTKARKVECSGTDK